MEQRGFRGDLYKVIENILGVEAISKGSCSGIASGITEAIVKDH